MSSRELATGFVGFKTALPLTPKDAVVTVVEAAALSEQTAPSYRQIRATFKTDLSAKDTRFSLSEHVANQLSVEEEEEKRFLKKVNDELEARMQIIKAEAYQAGFQKGETDGKTKGYEEEKVRLAQMIEGLAMGVKAFEDARAQLGTQYESQLIELSFKIAEVIVHTKIDERPEIIAHTVVAILERISKDDEVRVRLSPLAFDAIEKIRPETDKFVRPGRLTFDLDQNLVSGDCVVESLSGEIGSFLLEQIEKLKAEISKRRSHEHQSTGT